MERICEQRKSDNLSGLAIQWGAIGDVGVVQDQMGGNDVILGGTVPQRLSSCLTVLDMFLRKTDLTVVASTVLPESTGSKSNTDKPSLLTSVAKILGLKNSSTLTNKAVTLGELGIDSLMAVELKQIMEWYCELTLSTSEIRELSWAKLEELDGQKS
jgi:fatty acid synthase